ncbi:hypothetical protein QYE76_012037 [Lolium multiflorum]|uniref:Uncharacterized protein n=1 Tax=Lolium multiflorum TaxID=4521 RepID=A0AAD8U0B8_LOLMU|nr:hypothetical protein QYE76_012037 [Lolium multiflorum]
MENYSSSWETAAVMKMAVVSMEKPFGALSRPGGVPNRDSCPPDLGFAMAAALNFSRTVAYSYRVLARIPRRKATTYSMLDRNGCTTPEPPPPELELRQTFFNANLSEADIAEAILQAVQSGLTHDWRNAARTLEQADQQLL